MKHQNTVSNIDDNHQQMFFNKRSYQLTLVLQDKSIKDMKCLTKIKVYKRNF